MTTDLLDRIRSTRPPAFALLHRPETTGPDTIDVVIGEVTTPQTLAQIPLPDRKAAPSDGPRHDVLAIIPYRQVAERGFDSRDDGAPLITMTVTDQDTMRSTEVLARLPDEPIRLSGGHFDISEDEYTDIVRKIIDNEIGEGEGANFVIKRTFVADIDGYSPDTALTLFRRLLSQETGAYWTFVVHTGTRTFVGASPERHVSLRDGVAVMNPISGTYRYPRSGPELSELLAFLADRKETDELYMVVDEELKMMARICDRGGRVVGPHLKEMTRLAHTEYYIEGHSSRDPREILRETMFAPTVTGSPLESACRVISRYEPNGRGYYSGVIALIGRDEHDNHILDSSILIRSTDIDDTGRLRLGVGSTLVRHSDPASELAETRAKAAAVLAALGADRPTSFADHPDVRAALATRNEPLAGFWLAREDDRAQGEQRLAGRDVLVVDAEDTFTAMLDHELRAMGLTVTVRRFDQPYSVTDHDVVVVGPGPGDPREHDHPKIARLRSTIDTLLELRRPFVAVCLSHQVLCDRLGLDLVRRDVPNQGTQREIDLFGSRELVGFYNTFAAYSPEDEIESPIAGPVEVSRDVPTGEVHALRGRHFVSMQFHAESVLTRDGVRILATLIGDTLTDNARSALAESP